MRVRGSPHIAIDPFERFSVTVPAILIARREQVARLSFPLSSIQQKVLGCFFVLHGLAHAAVGIWAAETGRWWLIASLWELAMVGFIVAGLGALGLHGLRELWRAFTLIAASASLLLFLSAPHPTFLLGAGIDIMALAVAAYSLPAPAQPVSKRRRAQRFRRLLGIAISWLLVIYVTIVVAFRQWNVQWGTTAADRASYLPGDDVTPVAHYRIDHGVTIYAPIDEVWPWLIQIGQDRGGFYSYTQLENAVGADITNADRIVPAWQTRRVGELVPTVPSDYLGGRLGRIGCRVIAVIPGRALVLEGWGAFVLVPTSDTSTRMLIRTRVEGEPDLGTVLTRPFRLLVYEPAHLIMESRMLLGIKERAERSTDKTFWAGS